MLANNDGALETSMRQWMNCPSIPKEKEGCLLEYSYT